MPDIDDFLSGLQAEGSHHSDGLFTLDPERAKQLLKAMSLSDPSAIGICLMAFANASKAKDIWIEFKPLGFSVRFDGQALTREELNGCANALLLKGSTAEIFRLQQLAIALEAAKALGMDLLEMVPRRLDPTLPTVNNTVTSLEFGYSDPKKIVYPDWIVRIENCLLGRCEWSQTRLHVAGSVRSASFLSHEMSGTRGVKSINRLFLGNGFMVATLNCDPPTGLALRCYEMEGPIGQREGSPESPGELGFYVFEFAPTDGGYLEFVHYGISHFCSAPAGCKGVFFRDDLGFDLGTQTLRAAEIESYQTRASLEYEAALGRAVQYLQSDEGPPFLAGFDAELSAIEPPEGRLILWDRYSARIRRGWSIDREELLGRLMDLVSCNRRLDHLKIFPQKDGPWLSLKDLQKQVAGDRYARVFYTSLLTKFGLPGFCLVDASHPQVQATLRDLYSQKRLPALLCKDDALSSEVQDRLRRWPGKPELSGDFWFRDSFRYRKSLGPASKSLSDGLIGLRKQGSPNVIQVTFVQEGNPSREHQMAAPPGMLPGLSVSIEEGAMSDRELSKLVKDNYPQLVREACRIWQLETLVERTDYRCALMAALSLPLSIPELKSLRLFELCSDLTAEDSDIQTQAASRPKSVSYSDLCYSPKHFASFNVRASGSDRPVLLLEDRTEPFVKRIFPEIEILD